MCTWSLTSIRNVWYDHGLFTEIIHGTMLSVCAGKIESNVVTCANRGFADHEYLQINGRFWWVFTAGSSQKFNLSQFSR